MFFMRPVSARGGLLQISSLYQKCLDPGALECLPSAPWHSHSYTARWTLSPEGYLRRAWLIRQMNREGSEGQSGAYLLCTWGLGLSPAASESKAEGPASWWVPSVSATSRLHSGSEIAGSLPAGLAPPAGPAQHSAAPLLLSLPSPPPLKVHRCP